MKVVIIGLGLIGGSLAMDLRKSGFATTLIGVDENETHRNQARHRGLVDSIKPLESALVGADLVVLATPVNVVLKLLPEILSRIESNTTVTDMGSTKEEICKAVSDHPKRPQFVASHPMAGTEHSGPLAAFRGLFTHRTAVICDAEFSGPVHLRRIDEMYEILKMRKTYMSSASHDLHAAYVSHLSHISSFVLANTVLDKERAVEAIFDLAGGGFESTVRLAKSSPAMWLPIFEQNSENVTAALGAFIEGLQSFHKALVEGKFDETKKEMEKANQIRRVLQNIGQKP
jgi:prephenate dehydrogenase